MRPVQHDVEVRFPYEDAALDPERRLADLVSRLAPEDEAALLFHAHVPFGDVDAVDDRGVSTAEVVRDRRITHVTPHGTPQDAEAIARWHNRLQDLAAEHPLRIPVTVASDPRHGRTDNPLTASASGAFSRWPEPAGLAAVGSAELVEAFGDVTRREYLAVGFRVALHPQIDLATEYRWGRIVQTFGEDAALTGRLVRAYLRGLQGPVLGPGSVAGTAKHFPGGGPQRDGLDPHFADGKEQVYPGGMFDLHLRPFVEAIEAGVAQVMPYYGMPVGTDWAEVGFAFDRALITGLLRDRLGFDGVVCTDFGLITDGGPDYPARAWGVEALTPEERIVRLLDAGVDQFGGEADVDLLLDPIRAGRVDRAALAGPVRRLLREKLRLGLFDRRSVDERAAIEVVGSAEHRALGRAAQQRSLTLLRNEGDLLPLDSGTRVYLEGADEAAFEPWATVVDDPADADVAVVRTTAPDHADPERGFLGSLHKGGLEFSPATAARAARLAATLPTVIDVYLDRPAVLTGFDGAQALIGSYGTEDEPFAAVLFGAAEPEGDLPFDLPRSTSAVAASRSDVPFDTIDPLFRFGWGLRYRSPEPVGSASVRAGSRSEGRADSPAPDPA